MNRSELAWQVAGRTGLGEAEADTAVRAVLSAVTQALSQGEAVRLAGFGTFGTKDRPARTARNPRTGEPVAVPASRSVSFRAGKALRAAANRGSGA